MGWLTRCLIVICLSLSGPEDQATPEAVEAEWHVEEAPGGWTVGDPIPLRLNVLYRADFEVTLPELPERWGPFEVVEQNQLDPTTNSEGTIQLVREATVRLWAPGEYETPPLIIRYRDSDGQLYETKVPAASVTIVSVLEEGETEKQDLKPQARLPGPALWPWAVGGLLLAGLLGVLGWLLLTRPRHPPTPTTATIRVDPRSPAKVAYDELERIAALDLPARGELKRHYTLLAACMRTYVQGHFHIPALDRTTQELVAALQRTSIKRGPKLLLRDLLTEADLVKFAQDHPPLRQAREAIDRARQIVDETTDEDSGNRDTEIESP